MGAFSVVVKGVKELAAKLQQVQRDLSGQEFVDAMRRATVLVSNDAKRNAPVDTGRLRASITPVVEGRGRRVTGIVGSNVEYAAYVERPGPVRRSGRRPYLAPALTENEDKIRAIIGDFVGRVVNK